MTCARFTEIPQLTVRNVSVKSIHPNKLFLFTENMHELRLRHWELLRGLCDNLRAVIDPGDDSDSSDCTESSNSSYNSNACISNILDSSLCPQLFCHEVDTLSSSTSLNSSSDSDSV